MPNGVKIKCGKICYTTSYDTITEIRCQLSPLQSNTVVMSGRSPGFQINAAPILPALNRQWINWDDSLLTVAEGSSRWVFVIPCYVHYAHQTKKQYKSLEISLVKNLG